MTIDGVQFADGSLQENSSSIRGEVEFYNTNLVNNGPLQTGSHVGGSGTWTVPENTEVITMHVWGGGGSGSGHCCHGCLCDMQTCAAQSGLYARKTLRKCDGDFNEGDVYSWCYGAGGNGD